MKIIVFGNILLVVALGGACRGQGVFSAWGSGGFGAVTHPSIQGQWIMSGSIALGARYEWASVKLKRRDDSELAVLSPGLSSRSYELLAGYTFRLWHGTQNSGALSAFAGVGSLERRTPRRILSNVFSADLYNMVSAYAVSVPLELEFEIRAPSVFGMSISAFAGLGRFTPTRGLQLNLILGYW